jgi:hypothetical protein
MDLFLLDIVIELIHKETSKLEDADLPLLVHLVLREGVHILQGNFFINHLLPNHLPHHFHLIRQYLHDLLARLNALGHLPQHELIK